MNDLVRPPTPEASLTLDRLPGPKGLPLLGNLLQIDVTRLHTILEDWARRYGPRYLLRVAGRSAVVISDADTINEILRDRPDGFRRRGALRRTMLEIGIDGVFNAEGADWRRQRKLAMHAMNTNHLREFFGRLEQVTARLERHWQRAADSGAAVDAQRELMRFTVDVTSGLAFGRDLNTLAQTGDVIQTHLEKIFPALVRRLLAPFPYWRYVRLPSDRALDAAVAEVHKLVNEIIAEARERLAREPERNARPTNFLEALIASQAAEGSHFTDSEIVGNALTILLAGEDTTANTLAWMLHFMIEHPEVQARMREEADRVLGPGTVPADYATTESLHLIEAVAHEAMRLMPVAPFLVMEPNTDIRLGDLHVPEGTSLYLLTAAIARDDRHFGEASAFRPDRWLDPETRNGAAHDTRAFLPFGAGPRFCPGRHLAMLEIRMVMAMVCRNFAVERAPGSPPTEELFGFTMMPKNLFVRLRRRPDARSMPTQ